MSKIKESPYENLNPSFNDLLTIYRNDNLEWMPTKTESKFLKNCYNVIVFRREYVSRFDFPTFTPGKFRNLVFRLKFCLSRVINSRPPQYILRGLNIGNLTIKDTDLGKIKHDFDRELSRLKHQPPYIHDIKIETKTDRLYSNLIKTAHKPNPYNKGITIRDFQILSKIKATCTVYPNGLLLIHLACTHHPIKYSIEGWDDVISFLSQLCFLLQARACGELYVMPISQWIVTYYHFNKDGVIIDSDIHHYSIARLQDHSQIYVKKSKNGKKVLRYEEKITPNRTIKEEQERASNLLEENDFV